MNQLIEIYEDFDQKINDRWKYQALMQDTQSFIEFYSDFIRFDVSFDINENTLLKEFPEKLIIRLKVLYNIREGFNVLKKIKKYLFKLNNNQRADYQLKIFKTTFTRTASGIKKTSSIIMITRVISIVETIFASIRFKQNIVFKEFMCYNCDKADYYQKNCIVQDQIEADKKVINKARVNNLDIDEK